MFDFLREMIVAESMSGHNAGGWITPSGDYTETSVHIVDILQNPAQFGLTSEFIDAVYAKHGEKKFVNNWPTEGDAREEILKLVLQTGWIRFRRYKNYWSLTLHELNGATVRNLKKWIRTMIKSGYMHAYDDLKILAVSSDDMIELDADDFLKKRESSIPSLNEALIEMKLSKITTVDAQPALELISEAKLSRVYSHFTGVRPVAIITAFRGENTEEENVSRNRALAADLRSAGFGFIWVDGAWIENSGRADEKHVSEVSLMVIGDEGSDERMLDILVKNAREYNQDGFIFKSSGLKSGVSLYDKDGEVVMQFGRVSMDAISKMYTRLRSGSHAGRSFVFENVRDPVGFMGKMMGLHD